MPFSSTPRLEIRGFEASDASFFLHIRSQWAVIHRGALEYTAPPSLGTWERIKNIFEGALFAGVVEVKQEFAHLRRGAVRSEAEGKAGSAAADPPPPEKSAATTHERAVGILVLTVARANNRDAELGIALLPEWHNLGFGTEMLEWLIPYAFEQLALHRVSLSTRGSNAPAIKLYGKVGFREEGRRRSAIWEDGAWVDLVEMGIVEDEHWARRKLERERSNAEVERLR